MRKGNKIISGTQVRYLSKISANTFKTIQRRTRLRHWSSVVISREIVRSSWTWDSSKAMYQQWHPCRKISRVSSRKTLLHSIISPSWIQYSTLQQTKAYTNSNFKTIMANMKTSSTNTANYSTTRTNRLTLASSIRLALPLDKDNNNSNSKVRWWTMANNQVYSQTKSAREMNKKIC